MTAIDPVVWLLVPEMDSASWPSHDWGHCTIAPEILILITSNVTPSQSLQGSFPEAMTLFSQTQDEAHGKLPVGLFFAALPGADCLVDERINTSLVSPLFAC